MEGVQLLRRFATGQYAAKASGCPRRTATIEPKADDKARPERIGGARRMVKGHQAKHDSKCPHPPLLWVARRQPARCGFESRSALRVCGTVPRAGGDALRRVLPCGELLHLS